MDDVVHLKHSGLSGIDPQLGQDWHEARPERVELLLCVADLAGLESGSYHGAVAVIIASAIGTKGPLERLTQSPATRSLQSGSRLS